MTLLTVLQFVINQRCYNKIIASHSSAADGPAMLTDNAPVTTDIHRLALPITEP